MAVLLACGSSMEAGSRTASLQVPEPCSPVNCAVWWNCNLCSSIRSAHWLTITYRRSPHSAIHFSAFRWKSRCNHFPRDCQVQWTTSSPRPCGASHASTLQWTRDHYHCEYDPELHDAQTGHSGEIECLLNIVKNNQEFRLNHCWISSDSE